MAGIVRSINVEAEREKILAEMAAGKVLFEAGTEADAAALKGRSVLVTGGCSGLGADFVRAAAEAGAYVTIADMDAETGPKYEKSLLASGLKAKFVQTDVTDWASQVAVFKTAIAFSPHGAVDVVVTSAGISRGIFSPANGEPRATLESDPPCPDTSVLNVNLTGTYYSTKLAFHYFGLPSSSPIAAKKSIVLISSLAGYVGMPRIAAYTASKFGVRGMFKSLRDEDAPERDIRINLVAPTFMSTPMTAAVEDTLKPQGVEFGRVSDVTKAIVRLAGDDSINARAIAVTASGCFDLRDDLEGLDAGEEVPPFVRSGAIGGRFSATFYESKATTNGARVPTKDPFLAGI
ncbi:MAG: hypothetical protein M1832_002108 [Thelocarpon impressellum]|nr:MAG: hypothetical protein M1832_002108 [Thelocarpon impressellum]